jgi:hypothetical protein
LFKSFVNATGSVNFKLVIDFGKCALVN